jgi:hypothetical protein
MRSGNVHSTHAAFESSVTSIACCSNPGLWRLYILWLAKIERTQKSFRGKAKEVFYRGMRACPWAKGLYMVAFQEIRGSMTFEELRVVYRVLGEKELRVHVDLEDKFEEWDDMQKKMGQALQLRVGDKLN